MNCILQIIEISFEMQYIYGILIQHVYMDIGIETKLMAFNLEA